MLLDATLVAFIHLSSAKFQGFMDRYGCNQKTMKKLVDHVHFLVKRKRVALGKEAPPRKREKRTPAASGAPGPSGAAAEHRAPAPVELPSDYEDIYEPTLN
jgi:hypothetical protein